MVFGFSKKMHARSRKNLLRELFEHRQFTDAIKEAEELVVSFPQDDEIYYIMAECLMDLNKKSEALDKWEKAISLSPRNAIYHARLGDCFRDLEQYEKAIVEYDAYLSLIPEEDSAGKRYQKAECLSKLGDKSKAQVEFRKVTKVAEKYHVSYAWKGYAHIQLEEYDEAIDALKRAIVRNEFNDAAGLQKFLDGIIAYRSLEENV